LPWSFAPHHSWRFQMQRRRTHAPEESSQPPPQESSRENIRPVSEVSCWRQSAQRACAPGHPSWGLPPDRVHRRLYSPQNRHSIDGRSMLPPPAATPSPLPTHSRDPVAFSHGLGTVCARHDQPRQRGAADVPQAHASPAGPAAYAPGRPELGTTERCAFERVSRYRSDRWGPNILD